MEKDFALYFKHDYGNLVRNEGGAAQQPLTIVAPPHQGCKDSEALMQLVRALLN